MFTSAFLLSISRGIVLFHKFFAPHPDLLSSGDDNFVVSFSEMKLFGSALSSFSSRP